MENHFFDESGAYTESTPAHHGFALPHNALRVKPEIREGFWPVLNARKDGWDYVPDLRGVQGWLDGEKFVIEKPGRPPAGWSRTAPGEDAAGQDTPDEDAPVAGCTENPVTLAPDGEYAPDNAATVYITRRGVYHREGCRYVQSPGEWVKRDQARTRTRNRACQVCRPDGRASQ